MIKIVISAALLLGAATTASAQAPAAPQTIARADFVAQSKSQFALADANHDGAITKEELRTIITTSMGSAPPAEMVDQVFASLDTNKDGKATAAEVETHDLALFSRWDSNHDGQLSRDEMLAGRQTVDGAAPKQ